MTDLTAFSPDVADPASYPGLRWGVLGPGRIAGRVVESLQRHSAQRIVAVGSRSADRAAEFARTFSIDRSYGSYGELVADPAVEAVYIASPHSFHEEHSLLAISAGKHVLVEKPMARNAVEAERIVTAAHAAGLLAMEAMWMRFLPESDVVRNVLAAGVLGEIATVTADHGQWFPFDPAGRLFAPELAGGAMLDLGIYPLSFIHLVLGATQEVIASGTLTPTGVDASVAAVLEYVDAQAVLSTTLRAKTPMRACISGSQGRLELDTVFYMPTQLRLVTRDGDQSVRPAGLLTGGDGRVYQFNHFAGLVRSGRTESPLHTGADVLAILRMSDAIREQVGAIPELEYGDRGPDLVRDTTCAVLGAWLERVDTEELELARSRRPAIPAHLLGAIRRRLMVVSPVASDRRFDAMIRQRFWEALDAVTVTRSSR